MNFSIVVLILAFSALVPESQGLKCYTCPLENAYACDGKSMGRLEDCSEGFLKINDAVCMKSELPDGRTLRLCGPNIAGLTMECSYANNAKACICDTDGCNGGRKTVTSGGFALTTLTFIMFRAAI